MGRSFAEELPAHLEAWVREGLISPENAELLLRRNVAAAGAAADAVKRKLLTVLAILCAALLVGGLILVIAHNWDMLSPFWRLSMAYLPLLAGLVFGGFVLRRHDGEPCWCEPAALWIGGAAASAIAIVSQLYQVSGSLNDYLFWLILLCVPPVWLFRSTALALCCSVATVVMAVSGVELIERSFLQTALFFLLLAPWTLRLALTDAGRWGKIAGELMTLLLLFTLGGCALAQTGGFVGLISWTALFPVLLLGGAELFRRGGGRSVNLFLLAGFGGMAWMVVAGSFHEFWGRSGKSTVLFPGGAGCCFLSCFMSSVSELFSASGAVRRGTGSRSHCRCCSSAVCWWMILTAVCWFSTSILQSPASGCCGGGYGCGGRGGSTAGCWFWALRSFCASARRETSSPADSAFSRSARRSVW